MRINHLVRRYERGGANLAALRLHQGMLKAGVNSKVYSIEGENEEARVFSAELLSDESPAAENEHWEELEKIDVWARRDIRGRKFEKFSGLVPMASRLRITDLEKDEPDAIILHWLPNSFGWTEFFEEIETPILWRLPDLFPLTAGCHYPDKCTEYRNEDGCVGCPYGVREEFIRFNFLVKRVGFSGIGNSPFAFVAQSEWMRECLENSELGKDRETRVIPNGVNTSVFFPEEKIGVRADLQIESDRLVGLVCGNWVYDRKGILQLFEELAISKLPGEFELIAVGGMEEDCTVELPFPVHWIDSANADEMRKIYSAADILLFPSLQDNCPNVILEARACGLPTLCFENSGVQELILEGVDGILVADRDFSGMVEALKQFLSNERRVSGDFAIRSDEQCVSEYLKLVQEMGESPDGFRDQAECDRSYLKDYEARFVSRLLVEKVEWERKARKQQKKFRKASRRVKTMESSFSWRVTSPLREVRSRFQMSSKSEGRKDEQ